MLHNNSSHYYYYQSISNDPFQRPFTQKTLPLLFQFVSLEL